MALNGKFVHGLVIVDVVVPAALFVGFASVLVHLAGDAKTAAVAFGLTVAPPL